MEDYRAYAAIRRSARLVVDAGVIVASLALALWPLIVAFLLYRLVTWLAG